MAVEAGISEKEFFKMTPASIKLEIESFWKRKKNQWEMVEYQSWLSGIYVMNAIASSFSKKHKYPENPMKQEKVVQEDLELTEEQKDYYRNQFVKQLQRMEKRYNKAKAKENLTEVIPQKQGGRV